MDIENELINNLSEDKVFLGEMLKSHTTFKIGGPAKFLVMPTNVEEIKFILNFCESNNINLFVMGNGSNLLVDDDGFEGLILKIGKNFSNMNIVEENNIVASAGVLLSDVSRFAAKNNLTGLEFASGIPGALGGGIFMNAGAYDGELKNIIDTVTVMDKKNCQIFTLSNEEMKFGYRTSIAQTKDIIILEAKIKLQQGIYDEIISKMKDLNGRRRDRQPLEYPSAGSTFRRPEGYYAGKLIMDSGLRGARIGGAQVSEKHCGFVINNENASSKDVLELIQHIKDTVFKKYGVMLHEELRVIGK